MTQDNITYITDACLITCVVSAGKGDSVLKAARDLGVAGGIVFQGRGTGIRERLGIIGIAVEADKEIVIMMAANERRDTLINSLFKAAELNAPAAGFIYATPVDKAAVYVPETIIKQLSSSDSI
jgi:nitrogen regulatory protein P-II 1